MAEWKARFTTVKETEMRTVKARLRNRDDELLRTLVRELGKTEEEILAQGLRALYADVMLGRNMARFSADDFHACLKQLEKKAKEPQPLRRSIEPREESGSLWEEF